VVPQQSIWVPYGSGMLEVPALPGLSFDVVEPKPGLAIDLASSLEECLQQPLASVPLRELARGASKVCVVFTDSTRAAGDEVIVPAVLSELARAGVSAQGVTLVCGIGMHRPTTVEEKRAKLGDAVLRTYKVVDSVPQDHERLRYLGEHDGIPLWVFDEVVDADLVIATGIVEPHQYAGYSGGRKTVAIGAGGEETIAASHSPRMLERPGVRLGNIEGNPFHELITTSAKRAGLRFIVNIVRDSLGRVVAIGAGEPTHAFAELVSTARNMYEIQLAKQYDIVIAGVGHPKDTNLYQASRAATYVYFAPRPVLRPGGVIIIPARAEEGPGQGLGEQRFFEALRRAPSPEGLIEELRNRATAAGEQRAYMLARVLAEHSVIFVGTSCPEAVRACHMRAAETMEEALQYATAVTRRDAEVLVAPHALLCVLRGP